MNSLNITGLGSMNIKENWDHYVARVRVPSPTDPGITALEFIDRWYIAAGVHYDADTGGLYQIWERPGGSDQVSLSKEKIESMAIRIGYYGPIPLPKNVSVTSPNGDPIT